MIKKSLLYKEDCSSLKKVLAVPMWLILLHALIPFHISCMAIEDQFERKYQKESLEPQVLHLALDTRSSGTSLNYALNPTYKGRSVYAFFNDNLHAIDVYELDSLKLFERISLERDGPYGIALPEAIVPHQDAWIVFSGEERAWLEVGLGLEKKEKVRARKQGGDNLNVSLVVTPEFACKPVLLGDKLLVPVAPYEDFESKAYYKAPNLGIFDVNTGELKKTFSEWPDLFQKDAYYGALAEFSLEASDKGVFQSFTVTPEVWEYDKEGNKLNSYFLASPSFPERIEGLERYDNDLQEEANMVIVNPMHLRTVYNPETRQLFRLEKQEQELKDLDGNLNASIYGPWRLVWINLDAPDTIHYFDLPYPAFFIPNVFPYKEGIAIKTLADRDEDTLSFAYYPTK